MEQGAARQGEPELLQQIEHAAHFLPSQGPITVFVHHNTLHAFEDLPFDQGVAVGGTRFGCHAFLPEERYRHKLERGRIRVSDLEAVLLEDLGDDADRWVASFGTRYELRLAMLRFPLRTGPTAELRWVVAETDALRKFREEVSAGTKRMTIEATRSWVLRESHESDALDSAAYQDLIEGVLAQFPIQTIERWNDTTWEAFVLNFLWRVCQKGVQIASGMSHQIGAGMPQPLSAGTQSSKTQSSKTQGSKTQGSKTQRSSVQDRRPRDYLLEQTGMDSDVWVHDILIRFCAGFLDQGFAEWELPNRDQGMFAAFLTLYSIPGVSVTPLLSELRRETLRLRKQHVSPLASIAESLERLGVDARHRGSFITSTLLALRGWAGMVWQMETNAEWAPHPAPCGSLVEFLAIRLILDRLSVSRTARQGLGFAAPLKELPWQAEEESQDADSEGSDQRAFLVFQLAQVRGWNPEDLCHLSSEQWRTLINEIDLFPCLQRRRVYHQAFERKYRNETLDAVIAHRRQVNTPLASEQMPSYQLVCCIDEREESFRRALEEIDRECETFGVAGFFGVAMYYRGVGDAHFKPLCPVNIKPKHYIVEQPLYSLVQADKRRAEARKRLGQATRRAHRGTRTIVGGLLTGLFGSVAAVPLVARILFPRSTAQIRRLFGGMIRPPSTELRLERLQREPGKDDDAVGYVVEEMAAIVEGTLRAIGMSRPDRMSPLVVICGHGSASLNNPHEAAHDCGACGGGRGGPNARAIAQMANDRRVRDRLLERGLEIPAGTRFVGCYHNTCDDSVTWYDLDEVPVRHRELFERAKSAMDLARKHNAHERCRRFESADLSISVEEALRHVEGRAEDLSQTRPEYGHATNAICFVGRRAWSRGLFLDRRAFLTSYDPTTDDDKSSILERLLQAVVPVCAGINLEYYFSYVDPTGYGCGTKLPHNITSLIGVMDGAASDLRPGLPWQMVEIHEPVRLLFVVETSAEAMRRIINDNPSIASLVKGNWVQLAVYSPETNRVERYVDGRFEFYQPEQASIPTVGCSSEWYHGRRAHLGYATINRSVGEENS